MASLLLLIPLGLALLGVAVWAFFWAADHGQFEDLDTPALRILHDDEIAPDEPVAEATQKKNP
jgi:cbb3-type cytochrome oxidase maturation protein